MLKNSYESLIIITFVHIKFLNMNLNSSKSFIKLNTFVVLFLMVFSISYAQSDSLSSIFNNYTKAPRELAYVHLNKSVFVKGELMGFNAYILDKHSKQLSTLTTNLYCEITDENKTVVKSKLIKVLGGVAAGDFYVDSLFTSGKYTFKAYTNWMRNFDEQNYYAQQIKVIDLDEEETISSKTITNIIDVQFLPEGGHLVSDIENTIGIVAKDSLGFGVAIEGHISDKANNVLTTFKTNNMGIGKFLLTPINTKSYIAHTTVNKAPQEFYLPNAESHGINLSLTDLGTKVAITFRTNTETLPLIKDDIYTLTFHDGKTLKTSTFSFGETTKTTKIIQQKDLTTGVNVFTLFDAQNNPLLERLFFKYDGLKTLESGIAYTKKFMDSIAIQLPIKAIDTSKINRFSISVLPPQTKAYKHHHNIISYTYLQPYLKGHIQNASYYFNHIDRRKKYELDNLLITQGWSSYNWHTIFNYPPKALYDFEIGIRVNANVNQKKSGQFLILPTKYSESTVIALSKDENKFERSEFFLFDDETLNIGELSKKGKVEIPKIYLQFTPSSIPQLKLKQDLLPFKESVFMNYTDVAIKPSWEQYEELDEVVLTTENKSTKLEKLKGGAPGRITVFNDEMRVQYMDFAAFVQTQGYHVEQTNGSLNILPQRSSSFKAEKTPPRVYLNDMLINDLSFFYNFRMDIVDYIIVDKTGFGLGINGTSGSIKIYTDPLINAYKEYGKTFQSYKVPLTFTVHKKFYTPVYSSYHSDFYREYGVIDWLPNLTPDAQGMLNFTIYNTNAKSVTLFIEGIVNDSSFISEEKVISQL